MVLQMKAMITATLVFSYYWKILAPFCLQKKRPKNSFLTLTVNYCKIVQKSLGQFGQMVECSFKN